MLNRMVEMNLDTFRKYLTDGVIRMEHQMMTPCENRVILHSSNPHNNNEVKLWIYYRIDGATGTSILDGFITVDNWDKFLNKHISAVDRNKFRFRSKYV